MNIHLFEYIVRLDDLDYMNIVGNANWLIFMERARIDLLEKINFPFSEMLKNKIGAVVAEAKINYLKPAYFNDKLSIDLEAHTPFKKGLSLKYHIHNKNGLDYLKADLTMVFVDHTGKSIEMPVSIKERLFG